MFRLPRGESHFGLMAWTFGLDTMRIRLLPQIFLALLCLCGPALAAPPEWAAWMQEHRAGAHHDLPAELVRLAQDADAARAAGDELGWGLPQGYRLFLLASMGDAAADTLAQEVAVALDSKPALATPSAARLSLLLGLVRYRQDSREMAGLSQALNAAQVVADTLGQPGMKPEVDAARALFQVYETDAAGAETLARRAMAATQDPLLRLELFSGPLAIARIASINTPEAAQRLLADFDAQLAQLDAKAYPYMAFNLGMMKVIILRRVRQPVQAQEELGRWLAFAKAQPGFRLNSLVHSIEGGMQRDLKNWTACVAMLQPVVDGPYLLTTRIEALMYLAACQAEAGLPAARASAEALEQYIPAMNGSPGMVEGILGAQARVYELLGDLPAALAKLKAQRKATVGRYAQANEAARKQVETAYQVAARDKENAELKGREQLSEQRRLVLGVALAVAVLVLGVVAELLRRQSAQRRRLAELAGDLERVNQDLSSANAQLNALNASRTRLVAAACHDLRQPAHALGMLAEIASVRATGEERQTLEAIRRSSNSLSDLLDSLFDLSRLESDRYVPSIGPVPLGDLLDDLRTQFTVAALAKGLTLSVSDVRATVRSDPHLLRRMVMNLLSNAIKYTVSGGVRIQVARQGPEWLLSVEDTGPGIAPEQQEAAFSDYVRLDSSRGSDGLGIGLAIVKRSALLLGHRLELASSLGEGSQFTLWLPALDEQMAAGEALAEAGGSGQVIGLVDDDEQIRHAMRELLTLRGYVAHAAASLEALQQQLVEAGTPRPQLVLSDFHLAGSDSLDALASLVGEGGAWAGVPAVLVTGDLSAEVLARCQALGITVAYKPLPARKLSQLIDRLLSDTPLALADRERGAESRRFGA